MEDQVIKIMREGLVGFAEQHSVTAEKNHLSISLHPQMEDSLVYYHYLEGKPNKQIKFIDILFARKPNALFKLDPLMREMIATPFMVNALGTLHGVVKREIHEDAPRHNVLVHIFTKDPNASDIQMMAMYNHPEQGKSLPVLVWGEHPETGAKIRKHIDFEWLFSGGF